MTRWRMPEAVETPEDLRRVAGGHPLVARTLFRRGIRTPREARCFLDPAAYTAASPGELPGMDSAVRRVEQALSAGETICVWGDFDVDGQTATTLLVQALNMLGGECSHYIPNRRTESHGLNRAGLERIAGQGAGLVLTCDTGIGGRREVDYARELGVDVVVTDHHSLPLELPDAAAVVNPEMLPAEHPLHTLPGVGVAYKLAEALFDRAGRTGDAVALLDLVALGIVADLALQRGDTRYLLQLGLEALRRAARAGLRALYGAAGIDAANLNEETIAFSIAPRMNALGRLGDANPIVRFLTTDDAAEAAVFAAQLEGLNAERKLVTEQIYQGAAAQLRAEPALAGAGALVVAQESWHPGVVGIVASRLVEEFNKPAVVISVDDAGRARGSARSVEGVDIAQAIAGAAVLLEGHGGHPMAAGLSLKAENIPALRRSLSQSVAGMLAGRDPEPVLDVDGVLGLGEIDLDLLADLGRLGPFGPGNPPLVLVSEDLAIRSRHRMGRDGEHLRLVVADSAGNAQEAVWWRAGDRPLPEARFDLAYRPVLNDFQGRRSVQLAWIDFKERQAPASSTETARELVVQDYRDAADPEAELARLAAEGSLTVWGKEAGEEGSDSISFMGEDGPEGKRLAIWLVPPDADTLDSLISAFRPDRVFLFGNLPGKSDFRGFVRSLAGLLKYARRVYGGRVRVARLAALTGQSVKTVLAGLDWLTARGNFRYEVEGDWIRLAGGSGEDPAGAGRLESVLRARLEEASAYRKFYLEAGVDKLIG